MLLCGLGGKEGGRERKGERGEGGREGRGGEGREGRGKRRKEGERRGRGGRERKGREEGKGGREEGRGGIRDRGTKKSGEREGHTGSATITYFCVLFSVVLVNYNFN